MEVIPTLTKEKTLFVFYTSNAKFYKKISIINVSKKDTFVIYTFKSNKEASSEQDHNSENLLK